MTATRKIQSLAKTLHQRQEHTLGDDADAQRALKQFATGVRAKRGLRPIRIIAAKVGISNQQYSNIECGNSWPSMPVYIKLCRVLRISLPRILK